MLKHTPVGGKPTFATNCWRAIGHQDGEIISDRSAALVNDVHGVATV